MRLSSVKAQRSNSPRLIVISPLLIAFYAFLLPIAFDFRAIEAGQASAMTLQGVIMGLLLALLINLWRLAGGRMKPATLAGLCATALFVATGWLVGLTRGQQVYEIFRNSLPLVTFALGLLSVDFLSRSSMSWRQFWIAVLTVALLATLVRIGLVLGRGANLALVRYQILSGASPLLSGYLASLLLFGGWNLRAGLTSAAHLLAVLLSITRTQLLIFVVDIMVLVAVAGRTVLMSRRLWSSAAAASVIGVLLLATSPVLPGDPMTQWLFRLVGHERQVGADITAITREAEIAYQIAQLADECFLPVGCGLGAFTTIDPHAAARAYLITGEGGIRYGYTGFGHNTPISLIYLGGFAGVPLLLFGVASAWTAVRVLLRTVRGGEPHLPASVGLAVIGYYVYSLLGGVFGDRQYALFLGVSTGFTFWLRDIYFLRVPSEER